MRTLSLTGLLLLATLSPAAPALAEKPVRDEFAELRQTRRVQAVQPGAPAGVVNTVSLFQWVTGDGQIEVETWEELARRLKAPEPKGEASPSVHKMRVLNRLNAEGWEIVDRPVLEPGATGAWQFRRKVP
jgi:hypothetical protein